MERVVLEVGFNTEDGKKNVTVRVEEPIELANEGSANLTLKASDPVFEAFEAGDDGGDGGDAGERTKAAGKALYEALVGSDGIKQAIEQATAIAPADSVDVRLRFVPSSPADDLPWESLFLPDEQRFVGLDERWPLARLAGHTEEQPHHRGILGPFRVVAVLAAFDRLAMPELEAIRDAAVAAELACEIHVLCSEQDVKDAVDGFHHPTVQMTATTIGEQTGEQLVATIKRLNPDLIHVFAHGSEQSGFVEFATRTAAELNDPEALIYLDAVMFGRAAEKAWFTVLNVCGGAKPTSNGRSLAYALVYSGVPGAVGMRREIEAVDAHAFSRAFYTAAFERLAAGMAADEKATVDWAGVVRAARAALVPPGGPPVVQAGVHSQWTLPVLYVQAGEFTMRCFDLPDGPLTDLQRHKLSELMALQENLDASEENLEDGAGSDAFRDLVTQRIDALRAELYQ